MDRLHLKPNSIVIFLRFSLLSFKTAILEAKNLTKANDKQCAISYAFKLPNNIVKTQTWDSSLLAQYKEIAHHYTTSQLNEIAHGTLIYTDIILLYSMRLLT